MAHTPSTTHLGALFATVGLLTACGGGDSAPPPATTATVATTVLDGPLHNATVCLDMNDNGACDSEEPNARTAADGSASLSVPIADAGSHPLVAEVGSDAIDADSGPVTVPYVLSTPADRTAVISPLTTLVHSHMKATGLSSAEAERALQDAAGVAEPLLVNYAAPGGDAGVAAGARLIVVARQEAGTALQSAIGSLDTSGAAITAADIDRAVSKRLIELLPAIADAALRALDAPAGAAREAALRTEGQQLASTSLGLTASNLPWVLGLSRQPDVSSVTSTAGGSLDWFTYTDPGNWNFRLYSATAEQNTPDANDLLHFSEQRKRAIAGVVQSFGDPGFARTDLYFNGSAWFNCPADFEHAQTRRNAQGEADTFYCGAYHNKARRSAPIDIAGRSMSEMVSQIRSYPLPSTQGQYAAWGPDPASPALAGAVFPTGSTLYQQTNIPLANPDTYNPGDAQVVRAYRADVVAGGTPVYTNGVPSVACGLVTSDNFLDFQEDIGSLEQLVAANPGTPCIYPPSASSGPRNEWWSNSTVSLGTIAGPAPALPAYQSNRSLRIAFTGGTAVAYYDCATYATGGSPRNCDIVGTGTYSIEPRGDARVMRFSDAPDAARALTYNRLFVERGGKVYYGFRVKPVVDNTLRLNLTATDALLQQLGLSR
ncbi:MAG: hypothetical protein KF891_16935 [Rhizobacter sp.]|nr:hypothetical protein [Rhizobacter sp.]